jgi:hypothetical protein
MEEELNKLISMKMEAINLMYETYTEDLPVSKLEQISERHGLLLQQQMFWASQNNTKRFLYDLKDFSDWLYKFIGLDLIDDTDDMKDF